MELRLIADQAIGETESLKPDGLGFNAYARVLAQAAMDTPGPFTVGVFGEWGTGKTSLMHLVQSKLQGESNVVTVWFNAWRYEKEEHPVVPLVGTIIQELERYEPLSQKFGMSIQRLTRALRAVAYGFSAKSRVKIPGFAEVEASFVAKDMIDRRERLTPDPLLDRSLYYGAFASLDALHLEDDLRVVILIDDLDRCFPDQAIRLLESIKLVLAQPGFIFVLGVARQVIEGYLQHRYSSEFGIKDFKGQLYLDKIVQLPFHIPPASGRMNDFCARILEDQPAQVSDQLSGILSTVAEALGGNPRAVIRFTNNILVDLAINSELADAGLMERIPIDYFAISRCLEHRWPEVFSPLIASSELASEVSSWQPSSLASLAESSGPVARVAASLVSDQRLAELLLGSHGKSWLENSELRIASVSFLRAQGRTSPLDVAETPVGYDAFLSYHHEDRTHVVKLAQMLSQRGLQVFFDVDVAVGQVASEALRSSLMNSRTLCFCMGSRTFEWSGQRLELDLASQFGKPILPIVLPGVRPDVNEAPLALSPLQWLDLSSGIDSVGVDTLVDAIRRSPPLRVERQGEEPYGKWGFSQGRSS